MDDQNDRRVDCLCRVCNERGAAALFAAPEMMYGSRELFDYALCPNCGCLQIVDIPADLARHYPGDYYSLQSRTEPAPPTGLKGIVTRWYCRSAALEPSSLLSSALRQLLPMPTDFAEVGEYLVGSRFRYSDERILDVGCGSSPYRLAAMRRCGFGMVEGIDPFNPADSNYNGIAVYRKTIDQIEGTYGLVMFHHSLEHVPDPVATLREAARLLQRGRTCIVRVPVMGTYFWRRFGVNWAELDAPRHLHLFSVQSMDVLAERAGFHVRSRTFDSGPWEIAASIRYENGIALRSTARPVDGFSEDELSAFKRQISDLNQSNDAGRACFYLERI
jgi:SAM-dependent methyltransferase